MMTVTEDMKMAMRNQKQRDAAYLVNPYKVTFFKDKFPTLEKLPPIQM